MAIVAASVWVRGVIVALVGLLLLAVGSRLHPWRQHTRWPWKQRIQLSDVVDTQVRLQMVWGGALCILGVVVIVVDLVG